MVAKIVNFPSYPAVTRWVLLSPERRLFKVSTRDYLKRCCAFVLWTDLCVRIFFEQMAISSDWAFEY